MFAILEEGFFAARRMVEEGRLPEEDLMFFLNPCEALSLIETRCGFRNGARFPESLGIFWSD